MNSVTAGKLAGQASLPRKTVLVGSRGRMGAMLIARAAEA